MSQDYKICHKCGGKMLPMMEKKTIFVNGNHINIDDVKCYVCRPCGEIVYDGDEVKRMENLVHAVLQHEK